MQLPYNFTWTIKPSDHPKFFAYRIRIILYPVPSFCSLWTADVLRIVASLPPKMSEVREATTGNTSAIRRLIFLQTWKLQIDIAKFSDAKDTGKGFIKTRQAKCRFHCTYSYDYYSFHLQSTLTNVVTDLLPHLLLASHLYFPLWFL